MVLQPNDAPRALNKPFASWLWEHGTMSSRPVAMNRVPQLSIALFALALVASACSDDDASTTSPTAHPLLECGGERSFTGNYDLAGPGFGTAAAALEDRLSYYQGLYGGEIIELPDDEGALQVDGANVVVATARTTSDGGLLVQEDYYCDRFQPQQNGPPATEPLITAES